MIFLAVPVTAQTMQSSSWSVNQSLDGYSLDKNDGERTMTLDIKFEKPFSKKPQIILSVIQIDSDKDLNLRYNIDAISISRDGFTLRVHTWADSKIFSVSGYWIGYIN
jgi:hypothetical protein